MDNHFLQAQAKSAGGKSPRAMRLSLTCGAFSASKLLKGGFPMYANISNKTRKAVYRRDSYACALCDSTKGLQVHHVIPRGKGGIDSEQNLITLCCFCHAAVHGQPIDVTEMTAAGEVWWSVLLKIGVLHFILPAVLVWALTLLFRKLGWIKDGDMKIRQ